MSNQQSTAQTVAFAKEARASLASKLSEARTNQLKAESDIETITKTIATIDALMDLWNGALERERVLLNRLGEGSTDGR